jgi:hypothetical protein
MERKPLWKIAAVVVTVCTGLMACTTGPGSPTIPEPGGGGGAIGVNPDNPRTAGEQTKTVTYGNFTIPAAQGSSMGMVWNNFRFGIEKPCTNCYVTSIQAGLKYADGRPANTDTGLELHHMVLGSSARQDPNCGSFFGLGERFFASGNERTRIEDPAGYGYPVGMTDSWNLIYDLMSMNTAAQNVKIEMTYKYVPATTMGMKPIHPVWLDVFQCGLSEVPSKTGAYSYTYDWTVNVPGKIIVAGGHLHDGGTYIGLSNATTGQTFCNSVAGYGGPGYTGAPDMSMPGMEMPGTESYISSMTQCTAPNISNPVATVSNGQRVHMGAFYDSNKYKQMGTENVMGIAIMHVAD